MKNLSENIRNKKINASKMISFCHDKMMEASQHEVSNWENEKARYIAMFKMYHKHFCRYLNNDFTNRYSNFKKKEIKIDFSLIPVNEIDWSDLPL